MMKAMHSILNFRNFLALSFATAVLIAAPAMAETCSTAAELDPQTRSSLETTARSVYDMAAKGDFFNLKQNSVPSLANSFAGIEQAVTDNKANLSDSQPTLRGVYLLDASTGSGSIARAEFFCGIFNSPDRTGFILNNLPAGKYAVAIEESHGKTPVALALVLQAMGGSWKIGGFYVKQTSANGHDGNWYWQQAKQYAAKGQKHNAFFYYVEARDLLAPVPFMTTPQLDKLYDETQAANPGDLPMNGPVTLTGPDGKSYQLTSAIPLAMPDGLSLVLRQKVADASDSSAATLANMGLIKAAVAKWPETRDIFTSVVARAQDAQGRDYGSLLPMKEIK
jgi:hypothetical protein